MLCLQPPLLRLWPPLLLLHLCLFVLHLRMSLLEIWLKKLSLTCVIEGVPRVWYEPLWCPRRQWRNIRWSCEGFPCGRAF